MLIFIGILNFTICNAQSDFVILKDQKTIDKLINVYKILPEFSKTFDITKAEFDFIEEVSRECISNYNKNVMNGFKKRGEKRKYAKMYQIKDLKNYKIQYVPYLNEKGEKEIWINGFCDDFDSDWKRDIIYVFDGGNCYFSIKLNVLTGECLAIGTNGYA